MKRGILAASKGLGVGFGLTFLALVWMTIGTEAAQWRYRDEPAAYLVAAVVVVIPVVISALSLTSSLARR